jgi:hypothetical protein
MKLYADSFALKILILILIFSLSLLVPRAAAQGPSPDAPKAEAAEVEKLRSGEPEKATIRTAFGLPLGRGIGELPFARARVLAIAVSPFRRPRPGPMMHIGGF